MILYIYLVYLRCQIDWIALFEFGFWYGIRGFTMLRLWLWTEFWHCCWFMKSMLELCENEISRILCGFWFEILKNCKEAYGYKLRKCNLTSVHERFMYIDVYEIWAHLTCFCRDEMWVVWPYDPMPCEL